MPNSLPAKPKLLGKSLKWLRENHKESVVETAGAIEVDEKTLKRFEAGQELPSEDLLELLFNHFQVEENQAIHLRRLAGYDEVIDNGMQLTTMPVVLLGMDQRIVYSDNLHIDINPSGVTLTFAQGHDPVVPVSKIGMSHEQAQNVINTLEQALLKLKYLSGPLPLPPACRQPKKPKA